MLPSTFTRKIGGDWLWGEERAWGVHCPDGRSCHLLLHEGAYTGAPRSTGGLTLDDGVTRLFPMDQWAKGAELPPGAHPRALLGSGDSPALVAQAGAALQVFRSPDGGRSWAEPATLWEVASAAAIDVADGFKFEEDGDEVVATRLAGEAGVARFWGCRVPGDATPCESTGTVLGPLEESPLVRRAQCSSGPARFVAGGSGDQWFVVASTDGGASWRKSAELSRLCKGFLCPTTPSVGCRSGELIVASGEAWTTCTQDGCAPPRKIDGLSFDDVKVRVHASGLRFFVNQDGIRALLELQPDSERFHVLEAFEGPNNVLGGALVLSLWHAGGEWYPDTDQWRDEP